MTLVHPAARSSTHPPHTSSPTGTTPADSRQTRPQHTQREKEAPEMTLTALLDADAFTTAAGEDVPCRQEDPELWFAESPDDVEFAKTLCGTCPVQQACLAGALERREPWGVWGGQLFIGGVVVARKRPRGRPRKDAPPVEVGVLEASAS
jgi:WhiB family redox-sensing transcriptional regulator